MCGVLSAAKQMLGVESKTWGCGIYLDRSSLCSSITEYLYGDGVLPLLCFLQRLIVVPIQEEYTIRFFATSLCKGVTGCTLYLQSCLSAHRWTPSGSKSQRPMERLEWFLGMFGQQSWSHPAAGYSSRLGQPESTCRSSVPYLQPANAFFTRLRANNYSTAEQSRQI